MPFTVRKNKNQDTYKVTNTKTKKVYAYATKDPQALIRVIESKTKKK